MQFARQQYRQRPTKWHFLNRFYSIQREGWKGVREQQKQLLVEGRISVQAFTVDHNLETCQGWKWIQDRIAKAYKKPDPLAAMNQVNIYRLEQCVEDVEKNLERIRAFVVEQSTLPLEETEGFKYNATWKVPVEERQAIAESA